MSHPHTRKTFLAKVLGALAATGLVAPRLLANPASSAPAAPSASDSGKSQALFNVQVDPRSVARSGDGV